MIRANHFENSRPIELRTTEKPTKRVLRNYDRRNKSMDDLKRHYLTLPYFLYHLRRANKLWIQTPVTLMLDMSHFFNRQTKPTDQLVVGLERSMTARKAIIHKECLAVVRAVLLTRAYHEGSQFTMRTNQEALIWLLTKSDTFGKIA